MADKPTEGGSDTKPAPRRARKPRTASAAKRGPGRPKAAAAPAAAKPATTRTAAKPAAKAPRKASAAKPKAPTKASPKASAKAGASPAARVAKSVQTGVAAVSPSGKKKFAVIAAIAGVLAGIATVFGRRKITKAATEAIDAVSGADATAAPSSTTN